MKLAITRESLLGPLQIVTGVVERRQTLPILANVLLQVRGDTLTLTGTDLEVELTSSVSMENAEEGNITLPARKFLDLCRTLPEGAILNISLEKDRAIIRSERSRFTLATLPATEFPNIDPIDAPFEFTVAQKDLKRLIEQTQFSMAQQDVRYYLNGLMLEISADRLVAVATDGHRLAICEQEEKIPMSESRQLILPRKAVMELSRLLEASDEPLTIQVGTNHIKIILPAIGFTSKLIDGQFPDFRQVLPQNSDKVVHCDRLTLHQALTRASVLSNEKYRGMRINLEPDLIKLTVHNPEQEEAEEEIEVQYSDESIEIGFNVSYFMDALAVIKSKEITIGLTDENHSCLVKGVEDPGSQYVIMPMRL